MLKTAVLSLSLLTVGCAANRDSGSLSAANLIAERMLPAQVTNVALHASGYWLCDPEQRRRQARSFDQRYGQRVLKLSTKIRASGKAESDYIVVTGPCSLATHQQRISNLNDFEGALLKLEAEFRITGY